MTNNKTTDASSIQLKADFLPLTVIRLSNMDLSKITDALTSTIEKAPNYFTNAPVIIDVKAISEDHQTLDLGGLCDTLRQHKIIPVGIRGLDKEQQERASEHGLAMLANSQSTQKEPAEKQRTAPIENFAQTKIITKPVRAGSQVYAKDADLIITAAVNPGGEVIADGNIHIYGPLRGRALAGARGNKQAQIFCESLDAELISIAGHYLVKEKITIPDSDKPMIQIILNQDKLQFSGI